MTEAVISDGLDASSYRSELAVERKKEVGWKQKCLNRTFFAISSPASLSAVATILDLEDAYNILSLIFDPAGHVYMKRIGCICWPSCE